MNNQEVSKAVWDSTFMKASNIHKQCGRATDKILQESVRKQTTDNITALIVCFKAFKELQFPSKLIKKTDNSLRLERNEDLDISGDNKENILNNSRKESRTDRNQLGNKLKESGKERGGNSLGPRIHFANSNKMAEETSIKNPFKPRLQQITRASLSLKALNNP